MHTSTGETKHIITVALACSKYTFSFCHQAHSLWLWCEMQIFNGFSNTVKSPA